ncbi:PepSY-like domain-containing protein [Parapedobacter composti]|nr:PepSY-like domain-containing protein [Parapedobacter composti]
MKKILFGLAVFCMAGMSAAAQDMHWREVPAIVLNAFQQQFPKARQVAWERKRDGHYEAEFNTGLLGRDHKAFISQEGKVLRYEEEIASYALPDAVKQRINSEFAGYRIEEAKRVTVGDRVSYAVELESRNGDLKVEFEPDGKIRKERPD